MAKPRVFISSTFYDLKHVRAGLSEFVQSLGFEPILHEHGDIPYLPNTDLDESCRVEVQNADIVVLIVGGRYGSPASSALKTSQRPKIYDSVTRTEFRVAAERELPVWVLVEKSVWHDWENFNVNRNNSGLQYAHTEDKQIFEFIDEIQLFRNKSISQFEYENQIVEWLRNQWAGVFAKLFRDSANQRQLGKIEAQVSRLEAVVSTLSEQLDYVMAHVAGHGDVERVRKERADLARTRKIEAELRENEAIKSLRGLTGTNFDELLSALTKHKGADEVIVAYKLELPAHEVQSFRNDLEKALEVLRKMEGPESRQRRPQEKRKASA